MSTYTTPRPHPAIRRVVPVAVLALAALAGIVVAVVGPGAAAQLVGCLAVGLAGVAMWRRA